MLKFIRKERGQGLSEYAIIVALITVASIVIVGVFGDQIREIFYKSGKRLSGDSGAKIDDKVSGAESSVEGQLDDWK